MSNSDKRLGDRMAEVRVLKHARNLLASLALVLGLLCFPAGASATPPAIPKGTVRTLDGKLRPAPGYAWMTARAGDFRVRWVPGIKHPTQPNILAGLKESTWRPAAGYKWANNIAGDLRVVRSGPTDQEVARGVLKALLALPFHKASIPQRGDTLGKALGRGLARASRDQLIDSALKDLFPAAKVVERAAVRNLAVLALDGRLADDRDRVLAQLRKANPGMADGVQVAEFLIRLAKAAKKR